MANENNNKDLPLMANTNDVLVHHYILKLFCDFEKTAFSGSVIIHLEPLKLQICKGCASLPADNTVCIQSHETTLLENAQTNETQQSKDRNEFLCILDCCDILVSRIVEIDMTMADFRKNKFNACKDVFIEKTELHFMLDRWSLKIWKFGVFCPCRFPRFIKICYRTLPVGKSLMWVKDQDGKPAVYTYGAWINNRSLFPCQEPPIAMATWEASISVVQPAIVLMSGDNNPFILSNNGILTYYYYTKMSLPLSTLALAIGFWQVENNFDSKSSDLKVDIRICASPSLLSCAVKEFSTYIFPCIKAAEELFDSYPFPRIDFLIVPRGFASLGMASPNIIFLSQSLLSGDGSMCCRIAHEIAHAWFGLLIGASDWTEEWLSEGFATFCEDLIHAKCIGLVDSEKEEFSDMKSYLRSKILIAETENTEEELHVLRPNKGSAVFQNIENVEAMILKNGQNPEKAFMQVHYIKGFFLLKHLCNVVGEDSFLRFLRIYIQKYNGKLVDSLEMLDLFALTFPEICGKVVSMESIISEWLHSSEVPKTVSSLTVSPKNSIFCIAAQEATKWKKLNRKCLTRRNPKRRKYNTDDFIEILPDSLLILLDILLNEEKLATSVLKLLGQVYNIERKNAEVRHRWCEMIVKYKYYAGYDSLDRFLKDDLAMGVYLYGELILNGTKSQRNFAENCFNSVRNEMEPNCVVVIEQMINVSDRA